ncbi:hypothetical protein PCANC_24498 [Puccinia coronata f. sp. avenae]|uniref:Tyr recombinase domain-containing protein n=1 Tax=Puccinia coronata f. sp. avenae TaxID=200324 RepID=A0A2N5TXV7_9BASI|nr:hypothetical protein PCANC_24498 [Puccinia coronata f. sp. avenae]PLW50182.1 hypothetical protein PCASD_01883 [Puccinia coronata f. sp. avenae]
MSDLPPDPPETRNSPPPNPPLGGKVTHEKDLVLCSDVVIKPRYTKVFIREAKTGGSGLPQTIKLVRHNLFLCPIKAILRRLANAPTGDSSLFGYCGPIGRVNITRKMMVYRIQQLLKDGGFVGLTGHSFRVGGASLRHALGVPVDQIKKLGRWKSDCYKVYIKEYFEADLEDFKNLLDAIADA